MTNHKTIYTKKRRLKKSVIIISGIVLLTIATYSTISLSSSILAWNDKKTPPKDIPNKDIPNDVVEQPTPNDQWNDPVTDDYFKDALFIGDSRTQGFIIYTGLETNAYVSTGLTVDTALTKDIGFDQYGHATTLEEGLKQNQYQKIYIMLGINELGWIYPNIFIEHYQTLIETIQSLEPQADIYVQSILPVTQEKSNNSIYNNDKINTYNDLIKKMATSLNITYLNVREIMENENHVLPEEATSDGIHLTQSYCQKWLEYLKTHTLKEK